MVEQVYFHGGPKNGEIQSVPDFKHHVEVFVVQTGPFSSKPQSDEPPVRHHYHIQRVHYSVWITPSALFQKVRIANIAFVDPVETGDLHRLRDVLPWKDFMVEYPPDFLNDFDRWFRFQCCLQDPEGSEAQRELRFLKEAEREDLMQWLRTRTRSI